MADTVVNVVHLLYMTNLMIPMTRKFKIRTSDIIWGYFLSMDRVQFSGLNENAELCSWDIVWTILMKKI